MYVLIPPSLGSPAPPPGSYPLTQMRLLLTFTICSCVKMPNNALMGYKRIIAAPLRFWGWSLSGWGLNNQFVA